MVLLKFIISGWGAVKPYNRGYPVRNKSADRSLGTFFDIYLHKNVSKEANRRSCVSAVEGGCERTLSLHLRPLKLINMGTASTVLQLTLMLHFVYALLCNRWLFPCILRPIFFKYAFSFVYTQRTDEAFVEYVNSRRGEKKSSLFSMNENKMKTKRSQRLPGPSWQGTCSVYFRVLHLKFKT